MNIDELIARLQKIKDEKGNAEVELKEISYDRYGNTIGLVVEGESVIEKYFGGETPLW